MDTRECIWIWKKIRGAADSMGDSDDRGQKRYMGGGPALIENPAPIDKALPWLEGRRDLNPTCQLPHPNFHGDLNFSMLNPGQQCNAIKITNMTTIEREYVALESLQYYDKLDESCSQKRKSNRQADLDADSVPDDSDLFRRQ